MDKAAAREKSTLHGKMHGRRYLGLRIEQTLPAVLPEPDGRVTGHDPISLTICLEPQCIIRQELVAAGSEIGGERGFSPTSLCQEGDGAVICDHSAGVEYKLPLLA
jgi:hypothetical protein